MRMADVLKDADSTVSPLYACKMPHSVPRLLLGHPLHVDASEQV